MDAMGQTVPTAPLLLIDVINRIYALDCLQLFKTYKQFQNILGDSGFLGCAEGRDGDKVSNVYFNKAGKESERADL